MKYIKITATLKNMPRKIYRVFYVQSDINLEEFMIKMLSTFNVLFEHCFLAEANGIQLVCKDWIDSCGYSYCYEDYTLDTLPFENKKHFTVLYDTGEGYEFDVKIDNELVDYDSRKNMILISGRGFGILEDNIYLLYCFLKSKNYKEALQKCCYARDGIKRCNDDDLYMYNSINSSFDLDSTIDEYFEKLDIDDLNDVMETDFELFER